MNNGPAKKQIAITIDDLPLFEEAVTLPEVIEINRKILHTLAAHKVIATGFVIEGKLDIRDEKGSREQILKTWIDQGHNLGNHTYSHTSFDELGLDDFKQDVSKGQKTIAKLKSETPSTLTYFRYPYLVTGKSQEKRDNFERFLTDNGYRVAPITMITADWFFAKAYSKAKNNHNDIEAEQIIKNYIDFTLQRFEFNEMIVGKMFSRNIPHIWLLHASQLHADCMDRLLNAVKGIGYEFITIDHALEDKAYQTPDSYLGGLGVGSLYRWDVCNFKVVDWETEPRAHLIAEQFKSYVVTENPDVENIYSLIASMDTDSLNRLKLALDKPELNESIPCLVINDNTIANFISYCSKLFKKETLAYQGAVKFRNETYQSYLSFINALSANVLKFYHHEIHEMVDKKLMRAKLRLGI